MNTQLHQKVIDRIVAVVEQMTMPSTPKQESDIEYDDFRILTHRIMRDSSVISIWGDRGVGKSTLLANALEILHNDSRYVVLPPMSPELFGEDDTLLNVMLASVYRHRDKIMSGENDDQKLDFLRILQKARRSSALNSVSLKRLAAASTSIVEFTKEIQEISGGTETVWLDVQQLIRQIVRQDRNRRALIVSIDDADLVRSESLPQLVRQIRTLGSCEHLIILVAGNENDIKTRQIREAYEDAYIDPNRATNYDIQIEQRIRYAAAEQMRKTFPRWAIQRLSRPTWAQCLDLIPVSQQLNLRQILAQLDEALRGTCKRNVSEVLCVESQIAQNQWSHETSVFPVPTNLRSLIHFHSSALMVSRVSSGNAAESVLNIVDFFLDSIAVPYGSRQPNCIRLQDANPVSRDTVTERKAVRVDFDGLRPLVKASRDWLEMSPRATSKTIRHARVDCSLRDIAQHYAGWIPSSSQVNRAYEDDTGSLSLLLAAQDLILGCPQLDVDRDARMALGTDVGVYSFLQYVSIDDRRTDDKLILLPLAPTLAATIRVIEAWNSIVQRASDQGLSLRQVLALTIHASVDIFVEETDASIMTAPTDYQTALERAHEAATRHFGQSNSLLVHHYISWYQYWLPLHWHSAIFEDGDIRHFCDELVRISGGYAARNPVVHAYSEESLSRRLRKFTEEAGRQKEVEQCSWIGGYATAKEMLRIELEQNWLLIVAQWNRDTMRTEAGMLGVSLAAGEEQISQMGDAPSLVESSHSSKYEQERLLSYAMARLRNWASDGAH